MKHKLFFYALLCLAVFISFSKSVFAEGDTLWTQSISSIVRTVKFSPDGDYVYAAAEGRGPLKLDAKTGDIIRGFLGFNYTSFDFGHALDISPDGKTLVAGDIDKLYFFDTETGELKDSLISPTKGTFYNRFSDVKFTYDNKYLIACVDYGNTFVNTPSYVIIWDLETKQIIRRFNGSETLKLAIDQQNKTLAYIGKQANSENYDIALLEIGTWKEIGVLKGHTSRITDLSFSPDGSLLASCDSQLETKIWNLKQNNLILNFKPFKSSIKAIHLIENNKIALGGVSIFDWKLESQQLFPNKNITSYNIPVSDFDFYKNEKVVTCESLDINLLNADKLTSIQSDFTKDLLYPNPATNLLTVPKSFFENNFVALSITDITGKVVYNFDNNQQIDDLIIDISSYNIGSYYLNFNYKSRSQSSRFVKE